MHRFFDALASAPLALSFCAAFVTAFVRMTMQQRRSSIISRLCEAFLCSMLASAITQLAVLEFGLTYDYALAIAVFTAFLGTEFISSILIGIIKYRHFGRPDFPASERHHKERQTPNVKPDDPDQ